MHSRKDDDIFANQQASGKIQAPKLLQWFYGDKKQGGRPVGPCEFPMLCEVWKRGEIDETTLVWCKGMRKQERVIDVEGLIEVMETSTATSALSGGKAAVLDRQAYSMALVGVGMGRLPSALSIHRGLVLRNGHLRMKGGGLERKEQSELDFNLQGAVDSSQVKAVSGDEVKVKQDEKKEVFEEAVSLDGSKGPFGHKCNGSKVAGGGRENLRELQAEIRELHLKLEKVTVENEELRRGARAQAAETGQLSAELVEIETQAVHLQRQNEELVELLALRRDQDGKSARGPSGPRVAALISLMRSFRVTAQGIRWSATVTALSPSDIGKVRVLEANVAQLAELLECAAAELERVGGSVSEVVNMRMRCQELEQRCEGLLRQERRPVPVVEAHVAFGAMTTKGQDWGKECSSQLTGVQYNLGQVPRRTMSESTKTGVAVGLKLMPKRDGYVDMTEPSSARERQAAPQNCANARRIPSQFQEQDVLPISHELSEDGLRRRGSRVFGANLLWSPQISLTRNVIEHSAPGMMAKGPTVGHTSLAASKALQDAAQDVAKLSQMLDAISIVSMRRPVMRSSMAAEKRRKMASMVDKMMDIIIQRFEDNELPVPIVKVDECTYKLGNKKFTLLVVAGRLCIKSGGGHHDFFEHMNRRGLHIHHP